MIHALHAMPIGLLRCPVSSPPPVAVNAERRSARGWRAAPARCGAGSDRNCDSVPRSRRGTSYLHRLSVHGHADGTIVYTPDGPCHVVTAAHGAGDAASATRVYRRALLAALSTLQTSPLGLLEIRSDGLFRRALLCARARRRPRPPPHRAPLGGTAARAASFRRAARPELRSPPCLGR